LIEDFAARQSHARVCQQLSEGPDKAEIFLVGGRGNQRIAMSSDLIRDR
jgi:hypothetical protein